MTDFMITPMRHSDLDEVIRADRLVLGHTLGVETLKNELDINPFAHYFVMREASTDKLAGQVSVWIDAGKAQILNLYILPEFQGHKLGDRLLEFCLGYLEANQVEDITLEVRKSNLRAISLYEKYGFRQVATRKNYYDNGEDAFLMYKECEVSET